MARKEAVTEDEILNTAFVMTREAGEEALTARKVAARAGCSTQPIFRVYRNMEELTERVFLKAADFFLDYYSLYPRLGKMPFTNLGMAYISFAKKEEHLFRLLFGKARRYGKSMYELLNGPDGNVVYEIQNAARCGCSDAQTLFVRMWIMIQGIASMTISGEYDFSEEETWELLDEACAAFMGRTGN